MNAIGAPEHALTWARNVDQSVASDRDRVSHDLGSRDYKFLRKNDAEKHKFGKTKHMARERQIKNIKKTKYK